MSTAKELHDQAMDLVETAVLERIRGNTELTVKIYADALELELAAIAILAEHGQTAEPTWSVLHRGAGWMAFNSNQFRRAEQLVSKALAGDPHPEISEELRDLWEQANFQRHLELKGVDLGVDELQISFSGQGVGLGVIRFNEFSERIDYSTKLMHRIIERRSGRRFRERGRPGKNIEESHQPFISVPRAASFAITLKLGRVHQAPLPGMLDTIEVVDEFMQLMNLANSFEDISEVQERIPDPAYLSNFFGLAKKIAPDGERIRQVGFTVLREGTQRSVEVRRLRNQFPSSPTVSSSSAEPIIHEIHGVLRFADARDLAKNTIRIVDDRDRTYSVEVPTGMMNDIVRPMWDTEVTVEVQSGLRGTSTISVLQDIWPREADQIVVPHPPSGDGNDMIRLL